MIERHSTIQGFLLVGASYDGPGSVGSDGRCPALGSSQPLQLLLGRFGGQGDRREGRRRARGRTQPTASML